MNAKDLSAQLSEDFILFEESLRNLEFSESICKEFDLSDPPSELDMINWEALASRFARSVDLFTQKILKGFAHKMQEPALTYIDRVHLLEKLRIIESDKHIFVLRDLRNQIVHDYVKSDVMELYSKILMNIVYLKDAASKLKKYLDSL